MVDRVQIIGSYLSPYVRKVLVCLHLKGIPYEIDPIIPFFGDDRFSSVSPLRRVPVLIDGDITLADSSVICQYLEDKYPTPSLYPQDIGDRAQARWLEEFADTRMGEVFIWRLFNQKVIGRFVWGKTPDDTILNKTLTDDIPSILEYLESHLPQDGFLFRDISIADISIAAFFRNAVFAGYQVDVARWPMTAAFVRRVLELEAFQRLVPFENRCMRAPIPQHRIVLAEMNAPLTAETYGTAVPRRGMM